MLNFFLSFFFVGLAQSGVLLVQSFGVAEGRHKEDLKNMANAAGQSCRDYTPPGGETLDQVSWV